jgi:hypothetical protein
MNASPEKRLFHKPDAQAFAVLREHVWQAIGSNSAIKTL